MYIKSDDKEYIERLINNIFNYFNGRINLFQMARLDIHWGSMLYSNNSGITKFPNTVIIYPMVISRFSDNNDDFHFKTVMTVIHELYHVDQVILSNSMVYTEGYRDAIESAVEVQTMSYIYNHISEINNTFGFNIELNDEAIDYHINTYANGIMYHRLTYTDHILELINDVFRDNSIYSEIEPYIKKYFNDITSKVDLYINEKYILIKDKEHLIDINTLNKILYDYFYKYTLWESGLEVVVEDENNALHIRIALVQSYNMLALKTNKAL